VRIPSVVGLDLELLDLLVEVDDLLPLGRGHRVAGVLRDLGVLGGEERGHRLRLLLDLGQHFLQCGHGFTSFMR